MDPKLKRTAAAGLFAALALALNFPLLGVPNVELISFCLFVSGMYLGYWGGFVTPLIAGFIFVFFNPNGPSTMILIAIAQIIGFILFGLAGAIFGKNIIRNKNRIVGITFCAAIGVVFTFIYDVLTNAAVAITFGPFWTTMLSGVAFSLWHMMTNGLIFGFAEPLVVKLWKVVGPRLS